jgi:hypothetical protein
VLVTVVLEWLMVGARLVIRLACCLPVGLQEARFDVWAARLLARIPEAELVAVARTLERIRTVVLEDCEEMRKQES